MLQLREDISFGTGSFFRLVRWQGGVRWVEIVEGPHQARRIPAHGAHWHYHPAIETTFVLHGTSSCFVGDRLLQLEAGDVLMTGENVPHYWHHARHSAGLGLQWALPAGHGAWDLAEFKLLGLLAERARHGLLVRGTAAGLACRQAMQLAACTGLERFAVFMVVMHGMLHAGGDAQLLAEHAIENTSVDRNDEAVQRARSYLHAHYREPIGLPDLLRVAGMSRTTFIRHFQRLVGCCSSAYLNRLRLAAVCRELRAGARPVGTVALEHGFTQLSYFNRLFRRELGTSPSRYRLECDPDNRTGGDTLHLSA